MERRRGLAIGLALTAALTGALALAACQKAAPAANAANAASPANAAGANAANASAAPAAANVATAGPAVAPVAATGPDADAAKAFLERLYAHYKTSSSTGTTWAPMDANIKEVFDDDMVKLMAADTKALKGELGEIDGDWLCDCQDWGHIVATVTVTEASPTAAKAIAVFDDADIKDEPLKKDAFDLVKTPAGWRIHDMGTAQDASLRAVLTKEIADLKSGKTKPDND
ncbi:MAG TPA: hypothetical protein VN694_16625 [Caulobacteraceae bacterium]|nr:hypothetical protein [Caulobacteraceae bacterium]